VASVELTTVGYTQNATVTFLEEFAIKAALFLDNTKFGPNQIQVSRSLADVVEPTLDQGAPEVSLDSIAKSLDGRKDAFLNDLELSIYNYIIGTKKQCIAVVEKIPKGTNPETYTLRKYEMHADNNLDDFIEVLFKFMIHKNHHGHELDSALTDPVVKIVEEKYVQLYKSADSELSEGFVRVFQADQDKLQNFVSRLTNKLSSKLSSKARAQIVHLIISNLRHAASSHVAHVVGHEVTVIASTAIGTQVMMTLGHVLAKAIYLHCGQAIAHFLASAAFHKLMTVLLHKFLLGVVSATVLQFLAANVGVAIGPTAVFFVVIPIIAAILARKIYKFPRTLGKEVSKKVREELDTQFNMINKGILQSTFEDIFKGDKLVDAVAEDEDVKAMIDKLSEAVVETLL
jgi:hypothetical protein